MQEIIKKYWLFFVLIVIGNSIYICCKRESPKQDVSEYIKKIQFLESQIDSISALNNKIDQKIDTITITIEKTYIQYEKDRNTILNNTTDEDYEFFLQYIRSNSSRLDSINNF